MTDYKTVRLGKNAPKRDLRTLRMAEYLPLIAPIPPESCDWTAKVTQPWGMLLNDTQGDCTCAAAAHLIDLWTANTMAETLIADTDVLAAYEAFCGYNPADPSTDRGGVEINVLNQWRQMGIAGHKIGAYASINPLNVSHIKLAISIFGGVYVGIALPASVQGQSTWNVISDGLSGAGTPGSWGGHAVPIVAYDADGLTCITWGQPLKMSWAFWTAYVDEAYAIISNDFLNGSAVTPSGFNLAQLQSDLSVVTN